MRFHSFSWGRGVHGVILSIPVAMFTLGMITDYAYLQTSELQWSNFASWAIVGGLVFGGLAFLWSLIDVIRIRLVPHLLYCAVLLGMCVLGLVNAFKHSQDGWSSVGTLGMTLSVLCFLLALAAGLLRYSGALEEGVVR